MSHTDRYAILLSLAAILAAFLVAANIFEQVPHLEDEMAYVWQARVYAGGELTVPSPPQPKSMLVPFVVDYNGRRFAKYPPGWPAALGFGVRLGVRDWVNPLLAGLGVWLLYRLGQKIFDEKIGLLAAFLTLTSPFFLLNSGSLLSHPWALVLSTSFVLAWLDTFSLPGREGREEESFTLPAVRLHPKRLTTLVAGLSLGVLALTRPLTAVGVGLPFFVHGLILLRRGDGAVRRRVLTIGALALTVGALLFAWQYAVTGDALHNPYTLWWTYDKVGFGRGVGRRDGGHSLHGAWINLKADLDIARSDIFGWGRCSWLFLPFGLWAMRRKPAAWLVASVFASLLMVYTTYWIGARLFGPRYYYEGLFSLTLVSAAGIFWLARTMDARKGRGKTCRTGTIVLVAFLVGYNLTSYLPARLQEMTGLYGITRAQLTPFQTPEARSLTPALVIVHYERSWTEYGGLLELQDPWLTSPFIFAISRGKWADARLANDYPDRRLLHYYPDQPFTFSSELRGK